MMGNYYKQEDISSALSELMESPYVNSEPFLYSLGAKDCLKLVKDMVDGKVSDSLKIPAADVRENVNGQWIEDRTEYICSVCGKSVKDEILYMLENDELPSFCPYCGAKMSCGYGDAD